MTYPERSAYSPADIQRQLTIYLRRFDNLPMNFPACFPHTGLLNIQIIIAILRFQNFRALR